MLASYLFLIGGSLVIGQNYSYADGGRNWTGLCKNGTRQSPINLDFSRSVLSYPDSGFIQSNFANSTNIYGNWSNVGLYLSGSLGSLEYSTPDDYFTGNISQLYFFAPSQHYINGHQYPLEVTMVVFGPHNGHVSYSTSVFFKQGSKANPFIDQVLNITKGVAGQNLTLEGLFSGNTVSQFYSYVGSIPAPPCNETVVWHIVPQPLVLSKTQLEVFQSHWAHNKTFANGRGDNRSLQRLHGRTINYFRGI